MFRDNLMDARSGRTTAASLLAVLVVVMGGLLLVGSCTNDHRLVGPRTGMAHIPHLALSTSSTTSSGASFNTNKDDYAPGDTVRLSGSGWQAADVLAIHLTANPANHDPVDWSVTVDSLGKFTDSSYVVQETDAGTTLTITATSPGGQSATATFTDNINGCPTGK